MQPIHPLPDWLTQLPVHERRLFRLGFHLSERATETCQQLSDEPTLDYSFVVFPAAKAYEGFLKRYLYESGLIERKVYLSRRFRIGRALNPDIARAHRDKHWHYDDLTRLCGETTARQMWQAWLECRNHLFHFFPDEAHHASEITCDEARARLDQLAQAVQAAQACFRPTRHITQ